MTALLLLSVLAVHKVHHGRLLSNRLLAAASMIGREVHLQSSEATVCTKLVGRAVVVSIDDGHHVRSYLVDLPVDISRVEGITDAMPGRRNALVVSAAMSRLASGYFSDTDKNLNCLVVRLGEPNIDGSFDVSISSKSRLLPFEAIINVDRQLRVQKPVFGY